MVQEHEVLVQKIGGLVGDLGPIPLHGGDDGFAGFLAQLLAHLLHALVKEVIGVAAILGMGPAVGDGIIHRLQDGGGSGRVIGILVQDRVMDAAFLPGVAGRADLLHRQQERIRVTVVGHGQHPLGVPGGFPLFPQLLALQDGENVI